jgi:hypothetical protein
MLGNGRLIEPESVLQLLDRAFADGEELEDPDAGGVRQGAEEVGLERLELRLGHVDSDI